MAWPGEAARGFVVSVEAGVPACGETLPIGEAAEDSGPGSVLANGDSGDDGDTHPNPGPDSAPVDSAPPTCSPPGTIPFPGFIRIADTYPAAPSDVCFPLVANGTPDFTCAKPAIGGAGIGTGSRA
jgi:hypothetical protein